MPLVHATRDGGVTTVTMDSPANRNALSSAMANELSTALTEALDDDGTQVLVLTATGETFCSGADLEQVRGSKGHSIADVDLPGLLTTLAHAAKPTVAKVNGHARAGGIGLIGACDIALAPSWATFAFPEVRLGLSPAMIAVTVVPRLSPRAARRYLLTGEKLDADEAVRIGLLSEAVIDDLDAATEAVVHALSRGEPEAQRRTKQVLDRLGGPLPTDAFADMAQLSSELFASSEAQSRIAALLDRRR